MGITAATICLLILSAAEPTGPVVSVLDFGALPDDSCDDTTAVAKALRRCLSQPGSVLLFPPGRYDFHAGAHPSHASTSILVVGAKGLTIRGVRALLVGHGRTRLFVFRHCRNLTVEGLTIDWSPPPFSAGRVVRVSGDWFELTPQPGPRFAGAADGDEEGGWLRSVEAFNQYDPLLRRPARRGLDVYHRVRSVRLLPDGRMRVDLLGRLPHPPPPGSTILLRHQVYSYNAFSLVGCRGVRLREVTVYAAPGMGLAASACRDITLERFRVMIRPGSGRLMSTTADATHFNSCSGTILIRDCLFSGMGDDAVNVHGMYWVVRGRLGERELEVKPGRNWAPPPQPGHLLELSRKGTLLPYGEVRLKRFVPIGGGGLARLVLERKPPTEVAPGDLVADLSTVARLRILNCCIGPNRARGILIQTRDALVEGCRFEGCSGAAIHITCDADYWFESLGTRGVVIRNNRFLDCNYGAAMGEGVVRVFAHLAGRRYAPAGVHRNVRIENNLFRRTDNAAIFLASTSRALLRGNTFEEVARSPTCPAGRFAVYLTKASNVVVGNNELRPGRRRVEMLGIGPGCERVTYPGVRTRPTTPSRLPAKGERL